MYGLKTCGVILQVASLLLGMIGVLSGISMLSSPLAGGSVAGLIVVAYTAIGAVIGFALGGAAQALALIAANSDDQVRLLARLAKELAPSTRQVAKQSKTSPTYRRTLDRDDEE